MNQEKFLKYFITTSLAIMLISAIYILTINRSYEVKNYDLSNDYRYTGQVKRDKFNGSGVLQGPNGNFKGEFKDGRFGGKGIFVGEDFTYLANFDYTSTNKDIIIQLSNGEIYKKINGEWEMISDED